jgi:hypothetical protein
MGEAAMKYHEQGKRAVLIPCEKVDTAGRVNAGAATAEVAVAGDRLLPNAQDGLWFTDYSEEAIPERDPAYRLPDGTLCETQTLPYVPAAERVALARCLEQFGMSALRAAALASL